MTLLPSSAVLTSFLRYQDYPVFGWDVLIVVVALAGVALLAFGLTMLWRPAAYFIVALSLFVFVESLLGPLGLSGLYWQIPALVSVALTTAILFRFSQMRKGLVIVFLTTMLVMIFGGKYLSDSGRIIREVPQAAADDLLPPYIHIILDAHIDLNRQPLDLPGGAETYATMQSFFERYGFRVFPGAFSHDMNTSASIPNLLPIPNSHCRCLTATESAATGCSRR